jgi:putative transposase
MMQAIGRRYVGCFNARYKRTGTLWEGRFKSALVDSERYVLACYRYIELKPVRTGMAATAIDYRWSSHAHNANGVDEPRIKPHPAYIALDATGAERNSANQRLFDEGLSDLETDALRLATNQQKTWGSERFRLQIEALTKRELEVRPRGRPKLKEKCT